MRIGIMRSGYLGGVVACVLSGWGRDVVASFSRRPGSLAGLAADVEPRASDASAAEAAGSSEVVVLSVPGPAVYLARSHAGASESKPVIDTANGFGADAEKIRAGRPAAQFNKARIPGSHCIKRFKPSPRPFGVELPPAAGTVSGRATLRPPRQWW